MKNWVAILLLTMFAFAAEAQQLPFWTQTRSNYFMSNPAVAGYRKMLDARASYRYQWVGFEGSPKTMALSVHSRFYKGKMGAGVFAYQDKIGPQTIASYGASYAFHFKFEDMEFAIGLNGTYNSNFIDPGFMVYRNSHDQLIFNAVTYNKARQVNMSSGVLFYNENFYIGLSMNNMTGAAYRFRENKSSKSITHLTTVPHYMIGLGYNWAENTDFIWENSLKAHYVANTPLMIDYNLKMHLKNTLYFGAGMRLKVCIYGQVGYTFKGFGQIGYSYDYNTNKLKGTNGGTHEIKLVYIFDNSHHDHHKGGKDFQKKKFQYMM